MKVHVYMNDVLLQGTKETMEFIHYYRDKGILDLESYLILKKVKLLKKKYAPSRP